MDLQVFLKISRPALAVIKIRERGKASLLHHRGEQPLPCEADGMSVRNRTHLDHSTYLSNLAGVRLRTHTMACNFAS